MPDPLGYPDWTCGTDKQRAWASLIRDDAFNKLMSGDIPGMVEEDGHHGKQLVPNGEAMLIEHLLEKSDPALWINAYVAQRDAKGKVVRPSLLPSVRAPFNGGR